MKRPTNTQTKQSPFKELGASSGKNKWGFKQDEFLPDLRGTKAIKMYRQMSDNDPIIGACLKAMDLTLRSADWRVESCDDTPQAKQAAEFVESLMGDMYTTWDQFLSEALTFLVFGFSFFEIVAKRRDGPFQNDLRRRSRYSDGLIGIRKLAPRTQWTLQEFKYSDDGELEAFVQEPVDLKHSGKIEIPMSRSLLFRTVAINDDPTGRSVLRNAYRSNYYVNHLQQIEAIAIERELNGLPYGRIPSEYLASDATAEQIQFRQKMEQALRDLRGNEQSYLLLPSDPYIDGDGKFTSHPMVEFELLTSNGTRAIDISSTIIRHQQDTARVMLADFIMLGAGDKGSFALSKSKTDLFLSAIQGYLKSIAEVLNRELIPYMWRLNGFSQEVMPEFVPGEVAPPDLEELGTFIQRITMSGAPIFPDAETENVLRNAAGLPERADDSETDLMWVSTPTPEISLPAQSDAILESDVSEVASQDGLNGAQIRAVLDAISNYKSGQISRAAAIELVVSVGVKRPVSEKIISEKIISEKIISEKIDD